MNETGRFQNIIILPDFVVSFRQSIYSDEGVSAISLWKYLISLDLHKRYPEFLNASSDNRFVEIESLQIRLSYGAFTAIKYDAKFGFGYKLPSIKYRRSL